MFTVTKRTNGSIKNDYKSPLREKIKEIKPKLVPLFIKKWSKHPDHVVKGKQCKCNFTLTADGNWKLNREKCIYFNPFKYDIQSPDFGPIQTGCRNTPNRGSYYCKEHQHHEMKFLVNGKWMSWNPNLIVKSPLCK